MILLNTENIIIRVFEFSPFNENTYLVWEPLSREAFLLDPGCLNNSEENELFEFVSVNNLIIKFMLNTHCHLDHIFGNYFIKHTFPECLFYAPPLDLPLLKNAGRQASLYGIHCNESPLPDVEIKEEDEICIGNLKFKPLFTPGHTAGEFCFYEKRAAICFTGDVLFRESIGRSDLWGGNANILLNSITEKLFTLPEEVLVYPGHGESTTIGYEKINNPFFL